MRTSKEQKCAFGSEGSADGWYSQGPTDIVTWGRTLPSSSVLIPTLPTLLKPTSSKARKQSGGDSEFVSDIDSHDEML